MRRILLETLGFSTNERLVMNTVRQLSSAEKISTISKHCKMPHTTVSYVLRKLEKRKLIVRVRVNNHFRWKYRKNLDVLENISPESFQTDLFDVTIGMDHILKEFTQILELAPTERLYSIQGAGLSKTIQKIDVKFLSMFHKEIKHRKIIIEGMVVESLLQFLEKLPVTQLLSHLDRLTIVYILPDELIPFPLDIFVLKNTVLLIDYKTERLVRIEENALAQTFKMLFNLARLQGHKIDLNKYIRKLIEKKTNTTPSSPQ